MSSNPDFRLSDNLYSCLGIGNYKGDRELKGYIDEFYIFNRTLNITEVQEIHEHCKGAKSSQVIHLNFEEVGGNMTLDKSYQGNNGYLMGNWRTGSLLDLK